MFSQLSRGYGSWTAGYVDPYYRENKDREPTFPEIDQDSHFHGVTVGSRSGRSTAMSWTTKKSREPSSDSITIPKTYTTRRGALQLFVAPDDLEEDEDEEEDYDGYALKPKYVEIRRPMGQELIDLSLKLGTLERLAASVLQFGDKEFDHENSSITDEKNKAFLKFLHSIDGHGRWSEASLKPGGDLNTYLRDLKSSASNRYDGGPNIPKSRESLELQAILRGLDTPGWPMSFSQDGFSDRQSTGQFTRPASRVSSTGTSPGPPSTPKSSYQVLSSKKLAASIKSGTYLGRPTSKLSVYEDDESENGAPSHVRSASVNRKRWSPNESTDDELLNVRNDLYWGSITSGSIAEEDLDLDELKKRRRFKEKSLLTQSETLYQGRIAHKGDGRGESRGDVHVEGKGAGMSQISEELLVPSGNSDSEFAEHGVDGKDANDRWVDKVADMKRKTSEGEDEQDNESRGPNEQVSRQSPVKGVNFVDIVKSEPEAEKASKLKYRPTSGGSAKSTWSQSSAIAGFHAPSIVTLQSATREPPTSQPKLFTATVNKRRKSFTVYDPDKIKYGILGPRRKSGSSYEIRQTSADQDKPDFHLSPEATPRHYTFAPGSINWSTTDDLHTDEVVPDCMDGSRVPQPTPEDQGYNPEFVVHLGQYPDTIKEQSETGNKDTQVVPNTPEDDEDGGEDVIDNVMECDKEIEKIEERYDAKSTASTDSGTFIDEQALMKAIAEEEKGKTGTETDLEAEEVGETWEKEDITEDNETHQNDLDAVSNQDYIDIIEKSGTPEKAEEEDKDEDDAVDADQPELGDEAVDEVLDEDISELRSHRSSRKVNSKISAGSTEDGESQEDRSSILTSQAQSSGDIAIPQDEVQTTFSGSTASYSDVLASEAPSRPASAKLENAESVRSLSPKRPKSAGSSSRPASASRKGSRPLSAASRSSSKAGSRPGSAASKSSSKHSRTTPVKQNSADDDEKLTVANEDIVTAVQLEDTTERVSVCDSAVEETEQPNVIQKNEQIIIIPIDQVNEVTEDVPGIAENKDDDLTEVKDIKESMISDEEKDSKKSAIHDINTIKKENKEPIVREKIIGSSDENAKEIKNSIQQNNKNKPPEKVLDVKPKAESYDRFQNQKAAQKEQRTASLFGKPQKNSSETAKEAKGNNKSNNGKNVPNKLENKKSDDNKQKSGQNNDKAKNGASSKAKVAESSVEGEGLQAEGNRIAENGDGQEAETQDAHSVAAELDALGLRQPVKKKKGKKEKGGDGSLTYPLLPPGMRPKAPPEKAKIPDHLQDALKRRPSMSYESMERDLERRGFLLNGQVTDMVGESLSGPTLEAVGEGLTEEELELAKMILQKKLDEARNKIEGKEIPTGGKKKAAGKGQKKGGKKKKGATEDMRTEEEKERDAIRQKHEEAKRKRDEEAAELQRKIAERRALLQAQDDQTSAKSKEIREKMEQLEKEAEDLQRAEDEARDILADVRKKQREEREARRKADLERKRQEASDRRDREKKEQEEKRKKELEMMEKIADAEMRRRLREEEERRAYEEERLAQERYEEEMREAARMEEEAEERLKEMERQAEEEAMQRLIEEREAAERNRRRLMEEEEAMREAEQRKREMMEQEAKRLEEEQKKILEAEEARRELERQRLSELRRMEEEARLKMQEELENKRQEAVARRDFNLENRMHVDKLRHYQGITRAWTFSYFIRWPRDTYERPMGAYDPRKVKIKNPAPKKVVEPVPEEGAPAPANP